jgi:hypothetical protein
VSALSAVHLDRLSELDLSGSTGTPPHALVGVVMRHAPTLSLLVLDGVGGLEDAHVAAIAAACTNLRHLSIAGCRGLTDDSLTALADAGTLARLVSLNVSGCAQMTAAGLAGVLRRSAEAPGAAAGALRLRALQCRGVAGISDLLADAIAASAPALSNLDMGNADPYATALRGRSAPLAAGAALSDKHVTDVGLRRLAASLTGLRHVRLQGHALLSDAAVAAAARQLPQLETVDLRGCRHVAGGAVAAIAGSCPNLTELRLFGCTALTDADLLPLARCGKLEQLDLYGCRQLTMEAVSGLVHALASPPAATELPAVKPPGGWRPRPRVTSSAGEAGGGGGGGLRTVWVGGIPSVRHALAAVSDTSPVAMGASAGAAAVPSVAATGGSGGGVAEVHVQLSAFFPATVEVKVC